MNEMKTELKLLGENGSAFFILGRAISVARHEKWPQEKIDEFVKDAQSSDYDHLLQVCMKYFDVV